MVADPLIEQALAFLKRAINLDFDYPETPAQVHALIKVLAAVEASKALETRAAAQDQFEAFDLKRRLQGGS